MTDDAHKLHRTGDQRTSIEAAEFIAPKRTELQRRVWNYALLRGIGGFTDRELADYMATNYSGEAIRSSTYRTRRSELTDQKLIRDSGRTKTHPPSNRKHIIWVAQDQYLQLKLPF